MLPTAHGQVNGEHGTASPPRAAPDGAAVRLDDLVHDVEPQAHAGDGVLAHTLPALEPPKEAIGVLQIDASATITDADPVLLADGHRLDLDLPHVLRELRRVVDEIGDGALEGGLVEEHGRPRGVGTHVQGEAAGLQAGPDGRGHPLDDDGRVAGPGRDGKASLPLDPRGVQDVSDRSAEPAHLALDATRVVAHLRLVVCRAVGEELRHGPHGGDRGLELVRDLGEEVRLRLRRA